jgi:hypothetical protein
MVAFAIYIVADLICLVFGMPFLRIANTLNTKGVKPRRGTRWHAWSVNKILDAALVRDVAGN